jgi:hypothetical protein
MPDYPFIVGTGIAFAVTLILVPIFLNVGFFSKSIWADFGFTYVFTLMIALILSARALI